MTLLAIDAGNTRVKWARHDGDTWFGHASVATGDARTQGLALDLRQVQRIVASNVAGDDVAQALRQAAARAGLPLRVVTSLPAAYGVTNAYRDPARLGTDRWAALIGAHALPGAPRPRVVILAGTALTVDALDASGRHLGGIIVPGASLMREALARGTAQLPPDAGDAPAFPASTVEAINRGVVDALAGAVERFHQRTTAHCGAAPLVLGLGGALAPIVANLSFPVAIHENLIFEGLRALSQELKTNS